MAAHTHTGRVILFFSDADDVLTTDRTAEILTENGWVQTGYTHHGRFLMLTATYATDTDILEAARTEILAAHIRGIWPSRFPGFRYILYTHATIT